MRVVDYLVEYLKERGTKTVFMLSGTGSVYIDDAFASEPDMKYVCARHEAAATIMAMASAKLDDKIGVVISTTGPGGTNAIGGVVEAWVDSVPVLIISGQVDSGQVSPGVRSYGVQGFNVIENVTKITKYAVQLTDPSKLKYHLGKAMHLAISGRPGPVWLDIPMDLQIAEVDPEALEGYYPESDEPTVEMSMLEQIAEAIATAKRPLITFGQGVRQAGATDELASLLEERNLPSVCSRMAIDLLPHDHPNFHGLGGIRGTGGAAKIMKQADFVLSLASSHTHAFAGGTYDYFQQDTKLAMVNLDKSEINKPGLTVDYAVIDDVKAFIQRLRRHFDEKYPELVFGEWNQECASLDEATPVCLDEYARNPINTYYFIDRLNKCLPENAIVVNDAGSANYVCSQGLRLGEKNRELTSGAFYSMGLTLPMAIGAAAAKPDVTVVAVTGDGSIELNIQELRTMQQNELNIKLFIINNGGYASIRKSQDEMAGGRYTDDVDVLNFQKVAEAFEIRFHFVEEFSTLEDDLRDILSTPGPAMIELFCDKNQAILEPFATI